MVVFTFFVEQCNDSITLERKILFFFNQNISVLIDQNYTVLENQQVRIQWFTKAGNRLPEKLYIKAIANKLKLAENGYVRNHKLQGSQSNTKQKPRQVGKKAPWAPTETGNTKKTPWTPKITRSDRHEYHATQQNFKRSNNNQYDQLRSSDYMNCKPKRRQHPTIENI